MSENQNQAPRPETILISGASSGIGSLAAHRLADAGHLVYTGMGSIAERNTAAAAEAEAYAVAHGVALRPIELDVSSTESVRAAALATAR